MSVAAEVPAIRIEGLTRRFGDVVAVDNLSLEIARGELFALLGQSGCGKTTLLRLLAGFETPDSGRILLDGQDIAGLPPYARPLNMMFQSYALFPHMTVRQNVAFGLQQERLPRRTINDRVKAVLDLVQMRELAERRPHQLSGGQQQRAALARAIVKEPRVLLLDEPLSALDRKLREETRHELQTLQRRLGIAFIMVTHDQDEALAMADRIAVMQAGQICQCGTPAELYEYPASRFVADFIGLTNQWEARLVVKSPNRAELRCEALGITVLVDRGVATPIGAGAWLLLRPEKIRLSIERPQSPHNAVQGHIVSVTYQGDHSLYRVALPGGAVAQASQANVSRLPQPGFAPGDAVWLHWSPSSPIVLER